METIRAFVAIPLNAAIISCLEKVYRELKSLPVDVKWVRPESIHLTLKFLGDVAMERTEVIGQALERALHGFNPWMVEVRRLGTFPAMRNPRVVWVGMDDATGQIITLQERVEEELAAVGFEKEQRKFSPHLTLGRVRSPRGKTELVNYLIDERERELGELQVRRVVLFKSELKPTGAVYTELREFPL